MAKTKSDRLKLVKNLAERKEQQAAKLLAEFNTAIANEKSQLRELQTYYADYLGEIKSKRSMSPLELMNYRHFSREIADSVANVELKIESMQVHLKKLTIQWQLLHKRRTVFEDLMAESKLNELETLAKDEQKIIDELITTQQSYQSDQSRL